MCFAVDTSQAGQGDIDVEVTCAGQMVRTARTKLDAYRHRFTFVPTARDFHLVNVNFNYDQVPGEYCRRETPFRLHFILFQVIGGNPVLPPPPIRLVQNADLAPQPSDIHGVARGVTPTQKRQSDIYPERAVF